MPAEKNRRQDVIDDLFKKRCHEMLTRKQLIDHLINFYGYTYETSLSYYEDLIHFSKENVSVDYESDLAQMVEFIEYNIQTAPDSFTPLVLVYFNEDYMAPAFLMRVFPGSAFSLVLVYFNED